MGLFRSLPDKAGGAPARVLAERLGGFRQTTVPPVGDRNCGSPGDATSTGGSLRSPNCVVPNPAAREHWCAQLRSESTLTGVSDRWRIAGSGSRPDRPNSGQALCGSVVLSVGAGSYRSLLPRLIQPCRWVFSQALLSVLRPQGEASTRRATQRLATPELCLRILPGNSPKRGSDVGCTAWNPDWAGRDRYGWTLE